MGIFERFFGRRDANAKAQPPSEQATRDARAVPTSLQLLFAESFALDAEGMTATLRAFHPSMSQGTCELDPALVANGTPLGLFSWAGHAVKLIGFDAPMPAASVEACVEGAHYGQELKARARAHRAHLLLFYAGAAEDQLEQYVALAAVAGVLAGHGALVVLNEAARTSLPAAALGRDEDDDDESALERLQSLPIPLLYAGFLKLEVEGREGIWMRTWGSFTLGLPDLAFHAEGHQQGRDTLEWFGSILSYLHGSGASLAPGHTMDVADGVTLRCRAPAPDEGFLSSEGAMLVVERIPKRA